MAAETLMRLRNLISLDYNAERLGGTSQRAKYSSDASPTKLVETAVSVVAWFDRI